METFDFTITRLFYSEEDYILVSISIETLIIPYKAELLNRWKERNNDIVPSFMLDWKGPGISNGYGFGEWMAKKYLET